MILATITLTDLGELVVGLAIVGGAIIAWITMTHKTSVKIDDNPPPEYRKAPKRFNYDLYQSEHENIKDRLKILEDWRNEEMIINAKRNQRLMFALGKIAQKLGVDINPAD
jgi:anthranilate/para-aminobenzoate synthase component II